jgi:hypothetical protein
MLHIDVFNGDADGICALHQLRMETPRPDARLVTGVKREINLLAKIRDAREAVITVLDISLDRNRVDLETLLAEQNSVCYIDHHFSGILPEAENLETHIDLSPQTCTSLIVDSLLGGKYRGWAAVGAFGDNLDEMAAAAAEKAGHDRDTTGKLRETGVLLNYNGYGASLEDLYYHPAELYREVSRHLDPLDFHARSEAMKTLREGYGYDISQASKFEPLRENEHGRIYQFPAKSWARRVSGVHSNMLAREKPDLAHALIIKNNDGTFRISVRAPLNNRQGADELCRKFPTGGGRAAAAGINSLPQDQLESFHTAFFSQFDATGQDEAIDNV